MQKLQYLMLKFSLPAQDKLEDKPHMRHFVPPMLILVEWHSSLCNHHMQPNSRKVRIKMIMLFYGGEISYHEKDTKSQYRITIISRTFKTARS